MAAIDVYAQFETNLSPFCCLTAQPAALPTKPFLYASMNRQDLFTNFQIVSTGQAFKYFKVLFFDSSKVFLNSSQ